MKDYYERRLAEMNNEFNVELKKHYDINEELHNENMNFKEMQITTEKEMNEEIQKHV